MSAVAASSSVTSSRFHMILLPVNSGVRSMSGERSEGPGVISESPSLWVRWRVPSSTSCASIA